MSFGASLSDAVLLTQLAWNTVRNAQKACGEYDELTQQVSALHVVLRRFQKEASVAEGEDRSEGPDREQPNAYNDEIQAVVSGCGKVLSTLEKILKKYNGLGESERDGRSKMLWKKVRFGNGEMADLGELRGKVVYHTSLLTLFLNLRSTGSVGRVEQQMDEAGGHLTEIKSIVNCIAAAQMSQAHHEGSILSAYTDDDRSAWRDIRRELRHKHGFRDADLRKHKAVIVGYIMELANRGVLDDKDQTEEEEGGAEVEEGKEEAEEERDHAENDFGATVQSDIAASESSESLRLRNEAEVPSKNPDKVCLPKQDQDSADLEDQSSLESLSVLPTKYQYDYVTLCQELLWIPPYNEDSNERRCDPLSDGILAIVSRPAGAVDRKGKYSIDNPNSKKSDFIDQIQRWLRALDRAAKDNTMEWLVRFYDGLYNVLVVLLISISVGSDRSTFEKNQLYAAMKKKISQDLIRLEDIKVDSPPGLLIDKAILKTGLKSMQKAITVVKNNSEWQWLVQRFAPIAARPPRVVLVSREGTNFEFVGPSILEWPHARNNIQHACILCPSILGSPPRTKAFSHCRNWCDSCIRLLFDKSTTNLGSMPHKCRTKDPIALRPVSALLFDSAFRVMWDRKSQKSTGRDSVPCPINNCGTPLKTWDDRWMTSKVVQMGRYGKCSRRKSKICYGCCKELHKCICCIYRVVPAEGVVEWRRPLRDAVAIKIFN